MITVRVPLRVSFAGGGSDYTSFFSTSPGFIVGTTINVYVYVMGIEHTALADHEYKLTYRKTDEASHFEKLEHPVAAPSFSLVDWKGPGVHISTMADIPGGTGMGSSSAFTVGLLHLLTAMQGAPWGSEELAKGAVKIEREILRESGGIQDQYHAAYGGLSGYEFTRDRVTPHRIDNQIAIETISNSMVLIPVGQSRKSNEFAKITSDAALNNPEKFKENADIALTLFEELNDAQSEFQVLESIRENMAKAWQLKVKYDPQISNNAIEDLMSVGSSSGALAAKLCGAGGSGFILFIVEPNKRDDFVAKLSKFKARKIEVAFNGSLAINLNQGGWI